MAYKYLHELNELSSGVAADDIIGIEDQDNPNELKYLTLATLSTYLFNSPVIGTLGSGSAPTIQGWQTNIVFSATDNDTVEWTSGSIYLADGTTYGSVAAGNTGTMSTVTYIYFDSSSPTVLAYTTTASSAVASGKILLCVAENVASGKEAVFQAFGGPSAQGALITANNITAGTITANELAANTITANEISSTVIASNGLITISSIDTSDLNNDAGWTVGATWGVDINSEPTELSDINSTEGSKLSGIEAGADVTLTHKAKDIVNLPDTPSVAGFYADGTKLGFHDGADWAIYMENYSGQGRFYFNGDGNNFITWDGTDLTVRGKLTADDIVSGGTITGNTFQTAASGDRVSILGSGNVIEFYDIGVGTTFYMGGQPATSMGIGINFPTSGAGILLGTYPSPSVVINHSEFLLGAAVNFYVDAGGEFTGNLAVATPTSSGHAATKQYVDSVAGGVTDHGELDGLGDDDHTNYLNNGRHDTTTRHTLGTVVPHDTVTGLSDTTISSLSNKDIFGYNAGTGRWMNLSATELDLITSSTFTTHTGNSNAHHNRNHTITSSSDHTAGNSGVPSYLRADAAGNLSWRSYSSVLSDISGVSTSTFSTHTGNANAHHNRSHNITSTSDHTHSGSIGNCLLINGSNVMAWGNYSFIDLINKPSTKSITFITDINFGAGTYDTQTETIYYV